MCRRLLYTIGSLLIVAALLDNTMAVPHPPTDAGGSLFPPGYDNKFDDVNLDEILSQERLLNNYIKCLESKGPCTPDAKTLKDILPDAIATDCMKCSEKQKNGAERVTRHLIDNRPKDWERLEIIYDPEGTYRAKYLNGKTLPNNNGNNDNNKDNNMNKEKNEDRIYIAEPEPE